MNLPKCVLTLSLIFLLLLLSLPVAAQITSDFTCVALRDANNGVALLTMPLSQVAGTTAYVTTDGGQTWSPGPGNPLKIFAVTYADANTIYACGQEFPPLDLYGTIQKSTDNGSTWQGIYTFYCPPLPCDPGAGALYALSFWDASSGIAVGSPGAVVTLSSDTPTYVDAGYTQALRGVATPATMVAVAVGDGGLILKSIDGGNSWAELVSNTTRQLNDVCFVDASTGTAVGDEGTILRTSDGGATWSAQVSGTTQDLNAVTFRDASGGLAVGAGGTILSTIDGGATWTAAISSTTKTLNDVALEGNTIVAVGVEQTIVTDINATVPVLFDGITAVRDGRSVLVSWVVSHDEPVDGFRVYRADKSGEIEISAPSGLLPPLQQEYVDRSVVSGASYRYTVAAVLPDGSEIRSTSAHVRGQAVSLQLFQNYPNPFNPSTRIEFSLPQSMRVRVAIFDAEGRRVALVADRVFPDGVHNVAWTGTDNAGARMTSGLYFYRLVAGDVTLTRKMVLLK